VIVGEGSNATGMWANTKKPEKGGEMSVVQRNWGQIEEIDWGEEGKNLQGS